MKELYLLANLLICSIILKYENRLMYVYFSLWITIKHCYLFYCSVCTGFGHWEYFYVGFYALSSFLSTFLPSGTTRCSRIISRFSCLDLESTTSSRSPGSFCWRAVFRNQDLGAGYACCYWGANDKQTFFSSKNVCLCSHLP